MSDKQKVCVFVITFVVSKIICVSLVYSLVFVLCVQGLIKGVQEQFPDAEHRFCVRHLYQNIHQIHKGETVRQQLWACAKSTTVATFEKNMAKLAEDNPGAHAFVEEMAPNTWCRAFFSEFPKCDILLNNTCEVFNRYCLALFLLMHALLCS
jgi:hypothetical protein